MYVGATKRISLREARALGPRFVVQEKKDGQFVRLYLNQLGRVACVFSRTGREVDRSLLTGILGARLGNASAELVGELEAHAEAGNAAAAARGGQRLVHLFDCLHDGTRSLAGAPYSARRDALWRMWAEAEERAFSSGSGEPNCLRRNTRRDAQGRFARLRDTQVAPILPQAPLSQLERVWGDVVVDGDGEGVVLVALDAKAGARASKLKVKPVDGLDCVVHSVGHRHVTCLWNGHPFVVGKGRHYVEPGNVVEIAHSGWYGGAGVTPRFPSLRRVRRDLLI